MASGPTSASGPGGTTWSRRSCPTPASGCWSCSGPPAGTTATSSSPPGSTSSRRASPPTSAGTGHWPRYPGRSARRCSPTPWPGCWTCSARSPLWTGWPTSRCTTRWTTARWCRAPGPRATRGCTIRCRPRSRCSATAIRTSSSPIRSASRGSSSWPTCRAPPRWRTPTCTSTGSSARSTRPSGWGTAPRPGRPSRPGPPRSSPRCCARTRRRSRSTTPTTNGGWRRPGSRGNCSTCTTGSTRIGGISGCTRTTCRTGRRCGRRSACGWTRSRSGGARSAARPPCSARASSGTPRGWPGSRRTRSARTSASTWSAGRSSAASGVPCSPRTRRRTIRCGRPTRSGWPG